MISRRIGWPQHQALHLLFLSHYPSELGLLTANRNSWLEGYPLHRSTLHCKIASYTKAQHGYQSIPIYGRLAFMLSSAPTVINLSLVLRMKNLSGSWML